MNGARESLALGEDSEPVAQVRNVVLGLHFVSVKRFVTLYNTNRYVVSNTMS